MGAKAARSITKPSPRSSPPLDPEKRGATAPSAEKRRPQGVAPTSEARSAERPTALTASPPPPTPAAAP
jgi:hypothetical protein